MYAHRCVICGARIDSSSRELVACPECGSTAVRRDYTSVQIACRPFRPHFNHAVGAYVTSARQFDDLLKTRGDEAGATYTRLDPGDVAPPTDSTDILETQARIIHDTGIDPSSLVE